MLAKLLQSMLRHSPSDPSQVRRLHLGCGRTIRDGWINLDATALEGVDVVADLDRCAERPLPFPDDSIDELFASHVLEHIVNVLPLMQELHRISKPGAIAMFKVPYGASDSADEDPTHVRRMFPNSFHYFSQLAYWRADYGYRGDWDIDRIVLTIDSNRHSGKNNLLVMEEIRSQRNVVLEMTASLRSVKPARAPGSAKAGPVPILIERE